jgi:hypothetical protein
MPRYIPGATCWWLPTLLFGDGVLLCQFFSAAAQLVFGDETIQKPSGLLCEKGGYDCSHKSHDHDKRYSSDGLRLFYDGTERAYHPLRYSGGCLVCHLVYFVFRVKTIRGGRIPEKVVDSTQ